MKKLKFLALITAAALTLVLLASCASSEQAVYSYTAEIGGETQVFDLTFEEYRAFMSLYKFLIVNQEDTYYYLYYGYTDSAGKKVYDGVGDELFADTDFNTNVTETVTGWIKTALAERVLSAELGIGISESAAAQNKAYVNQLLGNLGGKGTFKQRVGCTPEVYEKFCNTSSLHNALFDYLYGENGTVEVTDEDTDDYYTTNYYAFRYLKIDLKHVLETDADGNKVLDGDDYKRTAIDETTDEGALQIQNKSIIEDKVKSEITAGTDFAELIKLYSDEYDSVKFADTGVIYSEYTDGVLLSFDDAILTTLKTLTVGSVSAPIMPAADEDYVYFVQRMELPEKAYKSEEFKQFFVYEDSTDSESEEVTLVNAFDDLVRDYLYEMTLDKFISKFTEDTEITEKHTVANAFMPKLSVNRSSAET